MSLLGPFMFKLINYKEKTNNPVNCLMRLGLYAHSVNSGIINHSILVSDPEYQARYLYTLSGILGIVFDLQDLRFVDGFIERSFWGIFKGLIHLSFS